MLRIPDAHALQCPHRSGDGRRHGGHDRLRRLAGDHLVDDRGHALSHPRRRDADGHPDDDGRADADLVTDARAHQGPGVDGRQARRRRRSDRAAQVHGDHADREGRQRDHRLHQPVARPARRRDPPGRRRADRRDGRRSARAPPPPTSSWRPAPTSSTAPFPGHEQAGMKGTLTVK